MKIYCEACKSVFEAERPESGAQTVCPKCGAMVNFPETPTSPGAVIGDFLIEREISKGGMGEVFLARQLSLDRPVALKVLQDRFLNDKEYVESLFREARAAGKINHPNIVQAYAVGEENGIFYFAMEYVRGETFKQILQRQKKLDFMQAAKVVREIASALDAAWREQKLVHQDIKPDNIMLDANGFAKLADLGLARVAGNENRDEEVGDEVMGTPQYISPEQLTGVPTDVRSDIYSLGATLYQFVTGRFPYVADTAEEIARMHVAGNLTPPKEVNPEIPDELNTIIMKMMARNIEDRYQTPTPLMKALDMFMRNYRPAGPNVPTLNLKFGKKAAAPSFKLPAAAKAAAPKMTAPVSSSQPSVSHDVAEESDGNVTERPVSEPASVPEEKPVEEKRAEPAKEEKAPEMTAENIPRPEMAPEPEAPQEETPPPRRRLSRRMKLVLLIGGIVLVVVLGAGGTFVFLAKGDKLPEPLKPYGKPVAEWFAARAKAATEAVSASEPEKKAEPVAPQKKIEPQKPATRRAYLDGIEKFLTLVRNRPDDREGQLAAGDEFFTRFPQPQTEEERSALRPMQEVYGRLDELHRAAPARAAARERHLKEIAERDGKNLKYNFPVELGGFSIFFPLLLSLNTGAYTIDADGAGRAVPALETLLLNVNGCPTSPLGLANGNNDRISVELADPYNAPLAEKIGRDICGEFGNMVGISGWLVNKDDIMNKICTGTITLCRQIGEVLRCSNRVDDEMFEELIAKGLINAKVICKGTVDDIKTDTHGGFDYGTLTVTDDVSRTQYYIQFQNENLLLQRREKGSDVITNLMTVPDMTGNSRISMSPIQEPSTSSRRLITMVSMKSTV